MNNEANFKLIAVLVILVLSGCFFIISAQNESRVFNKLTGADTTMYDALWVELRVDCQNYKGVN